MTLCIPFLMFQGQAQEAIDHYLDVFPDAELLEIVHHPEGTEIYDPTPPKTVEPASGASALADPDLEDSADLDTGDEPAQAAAANPTSENPSSDSPSAANLGAEDLDQDEFGQDDDVVDAEEPASIPVEEVSTNSSTEDSSTELTTSEPADEDDPDEVIDVPVPLVATAQLKIGGQVLMIQDSLMKHQFSFTPSVSVAVVVDSTEEFNQIVNSLAPGGEFLMEPGDYDFAANFAWVKDRFGMSWQVNQPLGQPEPTASAEAPVWG